MKPIVLEIADIADHYAITPGQEYDMHKFSEKFSELLIKECINVIESTSRKHAITTYDKDVVDSTIEICIQNIRDKFL